ncbi:MAG: hypothetical protein JOZ81_31845, partial [Chloroflexi bacterium]|nr:hypothetical protein [Chloroflexota bacterium]
RISPATARDWGLVNWVVPADQVEAKLGEVIDQAYRASRTAVGISKRLLLESFHRDPRTMVDELIEAERACFASWELKAANAAWADRKEADVRYWPRA